MAERKKFEEMLERLVNEDTQGAKIYSTRL